MANVTGITAVRPTANTRTQNVLYGATIAVGNLLVRSGADHLLCDANASAALSIGSAIAATPGVDGSYGTIYTGGSVELVGATLVVGTVYVASPTAGAIMPAADLATGDNVTIVGVAATATQLDLTFKATQIEVPA